MKIEEAQVVDPKTVRSAKVVLEPPSRLLTKMATERSFKLWVKMKLTRLTA